MEWFTLILLIWVAWMAMRKLLDAVFPAGRRRSPSDHNPTRSTLRHMQQLVDRVRNRTETPQTAEATAAAAVNRGSQVLAAQASHNEDGLETLLVKVCNHAPPPNASDEEADAWVDTGPSPAVIYRKVVITERRPTPDLGDVGGVEETNTVAWSTDPMGRGWQLGVVQGDVVVVARVARHPGMATIISSLVAAGTWSEIPQSIQNQIRGMDRHVQETLLDMTSLPDDPQTQRQLRGHQAMPGGDMGRNLDLE